MIGHTCPDIDRAIKDFFVESANVSSSLFDSIRDEVERFISLDRNSNLERDIRSLIEEHFDSIKDQFSSMAEDVRRTNEDLRRSAEKDIEDLQEKVEDLEADLTEKDHRIEVLELELSELQDMYDSLIKSL